MTILVLNLLSAIYVGMSIGTARATHRVLSAGQDYELHAVYVVLRMGPPGAYRRFLVRAGLCWPMLIVEIWKDRTR